MKTRLLKKLRRKGRDQIRIFSITKTGGVPTGMSYGFDDDCYSGLFDFGDTADEVQNKAAAIYMNKMVNKLRGKQNRKEK